MTPGEDRAILLLAVQFLTRLPVRAPYSPALMARIPRWFPAVGVLVGLITGAVFWLASLVWPPVVAALASTAAGLLLTGAFHEDGFADCCDGLGGGTSRERALEIMKDSRLGTYGAAGLFMMLAAKVATLAALPHVLWVLVAAHALSRASAVTVLASAVYVRDHGTGKPVSDGIRRDDLRVALVTAAVAAVPLVLAAGPLAVLSGLAGLAAGHLAMRRAFELRLGGYTGDCLGAVQQCSEIGFLLGLLAWL
ncbi:MAG: adenosylcobinamide-GDP ribazoletransferase [Rhodobacteraceae bacterium]|nr:adenosylcobinamide-GDP ribazoletransferase [Paracoccaceae bacterium]